jgi:hypothetical protein
MKPPPKSVDVVPVVIRKPVAPTTIELAAEAPMKFSDA